MESSHQIDEESHPWTLVVAVANNGVIGRGDELPWRLSSDLARFKRMTMGHCLVMGRRTYQSIGRPLPGRQTIVLTRAPAEFTLPNVTVVDSIDRIAESVEPGRRVMIVGGAQIYRATLDRCGEMWITRVLADVQGDVTLPPIDWSAWRLESSEPVGSGPRDQWPTEFQVWTRSEPKR